MLITAKHKSMAMFFVEESWDLILGVSVSKSGILLYIKIHNWFSIFTPFRQCRKTAELGQRVEKISKINRTIVFFLFRFHTIFSDNLKAPTFVIIQKQVCPNFKSDTIKTEKHYFFFSGA